MIEKNQNIFIFGKKFCVLLAIFLLMFFFPQKTQASSASFYLSPSGGDKIIGDTVSASVMISTDAAINAAEGSVSFSSDILQYQSVSTDGSIFSFWTTGPSGGSTSVNFGGGLASPGYTGGAGKIITITWKAVAAGEATITINGGKILANDGAGTNILAGNGSGKFNISQESQPESPAKPSYAKTSRPILLTVQANSSTHPDQNKWYSSKNISLNWSANKSAIFLTAFNQSADTVPTQSVQTADANYEATNDGVWYFHIRAKKDQETSEIVHYKFQIDTTPPDPFSVSISQEYGPYDITPKIKYEAEDDLSGIEKYEIIIDNQDPLIIKSGRDLPKQKVGSHTVTVKAYDKAGNIRASKTNFQISDPNIATVKIFGYNIPVKYVITSLLVSISALVATSAYLWRLLYASTVRGFSAAGAIFGRIKKIFTKTESEIDKDIDEAISANALTQESVEIMKQNLKKKIHATIEEEENEIQENKLKGDNNQENSLK